MKFTLRGASSAALVIGIMGGAAWAQEAPAAAPAEAETVQAAPQAVEPAAPQVVDQVAPETGVTADLGDRIVVTGSLVAGASEDAPSPVEAFDLEALQNQGSPTAAEFLRSLTLSTEAAGEADSQIAGAGAGLATVNLRGLGTGRTLVLLNGNKFASSSTNVADINTLPTMAIGQIEVLKDGASVTYGAGAVGGVINYITRRNFEGFEVSAEKKFFDGSDGEDNIEALWGLQGDSSNILVAGSWGRRHALAQNKRDYSTLPFDQQPASWTFYTSNPSQYVLQGASSNFSTIRDYTVGANGTCEAIGGARTGDLSNAVPAPSSAAFFANDCAIPFYNTYNLIDEEEYVRGYFEYNSDFSDTMEFHFETAYAKTTDPNVRTGQSLPSGGNTAQLQWGGTFSIPYYQTTYSATGAPVNTTCITGRSTTAGVDTCLVNPYAAEFFNRAAATGVYSGVRGNVDTSTYYRWRPLMFGPNGAFDSGLRTERQERERFGGAASLKGDFTSDGLVGRFLPEGTTFEYTANYSQYTQDSSRPDWIVSRLQNALNGYGGPDCNAIDRVVTDFTSATAYDNTVGIQSDTTPGTNGCLYFNPFASSFESSVINGAANPAYGGAAYENPAELLRWLTHERRYETINSALTFNAVFTGEIPGFELPGGTIGWAAGSEWRQTEERGRVLGSQEDIEIAAMHCPWGEDTSLPATTPGLNACYADRGPFFSSGLPALRPYNADRQVTSYYGELQIPVLDNLNFQLAGRHEDYSDGYSGSIWKVAGKYDLTDTLSFRGSYSTNFQAPPEGLGAAGDEQGTVYVGSLFRNVSTTTLTSGGLSPEDDKAMNLGVIFAPEVFGGQLRASLDFWEIIIDKEVTSTSLTPVFISLFGTTSPNSSTALLAGGCSTLPFSNLVTWDAACNDTAAVGAGRTTAANILNMTRYNLNSGGFITNGFDFSVDYTHDLGPGEIYAAIQGTNVQHYKVKGYALPDGTTYVQDFNGLGSANFNPGAGTIMPRWRANATLGYRLENHRFNLRANYISGFQDDSGSNEDGRTTVVEVVNGVPVYPTFGITPEDYTDFDFSWIYAAPFWQDLELRLSVLNITDEDPMAAQHTTAGGLVQDTRTGYYPSYGNPRGRQIEIGVTKKF
ncbi:MAG TPA: TonB-dependent receptor [Hyphomonadaceae bacterium]|nr:TonB-dependent receptor [Hyphomonadaceae bacterium]